MGLQTFAARPSRPNVQGQPPEARVEPEPRAFGERWRARCVAPSLIAVRSATRSPAYARPLDSQGNFQRTASERGPLYLWHSPDTLTAPARHRGVRER